MTKTFATSEGGSVVFDQNELKAELEKAQTQDEFAAKDSSAEVMTFDAAAIKSACDRDQSPTGLDIRSNCDPVPGWKQIADKELAMLSRNVRNTHIREEVEQEAVFLIGKNIQNLETGFKAAISKHSFYKMLHRSAIFSSVSDEAHYVAVGNLDKLFRLATVGPVKPCSRTTTASAIAAVRHFDVPMPFKGEVLHVKLLIKESKPALFELYRVYTIHSLQVVPISN